MRVPREEMKSFAVVRARIFRFGGTNIQSYSKTGQTYKRGAKIAQQ
jgi:hypothetical protein